MWSTPAVWKQYNKMAVLHFFRVNSTLYIIYSLWAYRTENTRHEVARISKPKNRNTFILKPELRFINLNLFWQKSASPPPPPGLVEILHVIYLIKSLFSSLRLIRYLSIHWQVIRSTSRFKPHHFQGG